MAFNWLDETVGGTLYGCNGCGIVVMGPPDICPVCELARDEAPQFKERTDGEA